MVTDYEFKYYRETARQISIHLREREILLFSGIEEMAACFNDFGESCSDSLRLKMPSSTDVKITEQRFIIKHGMSSRPTETGGFTSLMI
jgi:hypothetical protein